MAEEEDGQSRIDLLICFGALEVVLEYLRRLRGFYLEVVLVEGLEWHLVAAILVALLVWVGYVDSVLVVRLLPLFIIWITLDMGLHVVLFEIFKSSFGIESSGHCVNLSHSIL